METILKEKENDHDISAENIGLGFKPLYGADEGELDRSRGIFAGRCLSEYQKGYGSSGDAEKGDGI